MAAAITGTPANGKTSGQQASLTISFTSSTDPLYVIVEGWLATFSTVTFGGVALRNVAGATVASRRFEVWVLDAPSASTANIVITPTASTWMTAGIFNTTGVDADGVIRNFGTASGTGTAAAVVVSSNTNDLVLGMVVSDATNQGFTVAGGETSVHEQDAIAGTDERSALSYEAGAASVTISWTLSVSDSWGMCGFSLPADGTVSPQPIRVSRTSAKMVLNPGFTPVAQVSRVSMKVLLSDSLFPVAHVSRTHIKVVMQYTPPTTAPKSAVFFGEGGVGDGDTWIE